MKTARVILTYLDNTEAEYYFIENEADLKEYAAFTMNIAERASREVLNSGVSINKFDHLIPSQSAEGGIMTMALIKAKGNRLKNDLSLAEPDEEFFSIWNNPLWHVFPAALQKIDIMRSSLTKGEKLLVNRCGGITPVFDGTKIVEIYDKELEDGIPKDIIKKATAYIVLENDYVLPRESERYLKAVDPNHSTIFNLRGRFHYLEDRLKKFMDNGGHTVFVYTTGMDVKQMYDYTKIILKVGLKNLVFHFNTGLTDDIQEYLNDTRGKLNLTVLEQLPG